MVVVIFNILTFPQTAALSLSLAIFARSRLSSVVISVLGCRVMCSVSPPVPAHRLCTPGVNCLQPNCIYFNLFVVPIPRGRLDCTACPLFPPFSGARAPSLSPAAGAAHVIVWRLSDYPLLLLLCCLICMQITTPDWPFNCSGTDNSSECPSSRLLVCLLGYLPAEKGYRVGHDRLRHLCLSWRSH